MRLTAPPFPSACPSTSAAPSPRVHPQSPSVRHAGHLNEAEGARARWLPRHFNAGETIDPSALAGQGTWRLTQGAVRIDREPQAHDGADNGHDAHVETSRRLALQIALPGDLLPPALMPDWYSRYRLRAIADTTLVPVADGPAERTALLTEALQQQWRRSEDMVALRSGPVPERVRHLLLMLAQPASGAPSLRLPSVRDIADTLDTSPESVSRTMTALRRMGLLVERHGSHTRFDADRLARDVLPVGITRSVPLARRSGRGHRAAGGTAAARPGAPGNADPAVTDAA